MQHAGIVRERAIALPHARDGIVNARLAFSRRERFFEDCGEQHTGGRTLTRIVARHLRHYDREVIVQSRDQQVVGAYWTGRNAGE